MHILNYKINIKLKFKKEGTQVLFLEFVDKDFLRNKQRHC